MSGTSVGARRRSAALPTSSLVTPVPQAVANQATTTTPATRTQPPLLLRRRSTREGSTDGAGHLSAPVGSSPAGAILVVRGGGIGEQGSLALAWFLGLFILALTPAVVFVTVFFEPGYQAFRREIAREMQYVEPLLVGLTIVEDWEECGQGEDPLCSDVVLLVDDSEVEPPVDRVRVALMSKGWHETEGTLRSFKGLDARRRGPGLKSAGSST